MVTEHRHRFNGSSCVSSNPRLEYASFFSSEKHENSQRHSVPPHQKIKWRRSSLITGVFILLAVGILIDHSFSSLFSYSMSAASRSVESDRSREAHKLTSEHRDGAFQFLADRRKAYAESKRLPQFPFRGVGYIFTQHEMVLTALVPTSPIQLGQNVITVQDVNTLRRNDCQKLTIWVRVNGPEIFSGTADAIMNDETGTCHWEFSFDLRVAGVYKVDARLLNWNGNVLDNDPNSMPIIHDSKVPFQKYPHHVSVKGFKLYDPMHSCCETCTRVSGCVYWSTPALHFKSNWGCELYFNNSAATVPFQYYTEDVEEEYVKKEMRDQTIAHGPPHSKSVSYYMGCGWNFFLTGVSQCESPMDDAIHMQSNTFAMNVNKEKDENEVNPQPMCDMNKHEHKKGRWVREEYPDESVCPTEFDTRKGIYERLKHHNMLMFQSNQPHCWFRDDISKLGTRCFVDGCGTNRAHIWKSSLARETKWFGMWRNYECEYAELTNNQLQQCFDRRKIVGMQTHGSSVAGYINEYLQQRISHVKFYNATTTRTPKEQTLNVTLDTFSSPHFMWHNSSEEWRKEFKGFPSPKNWEEHYYVETMYFVSEREPFCTAPRAEVINRDMEDILVPKGYKRLSAFDMSSAFSYDTATQFDGMHIIGPSLRMIVTKLFHYVCKDHIGSSVIATS